MTKDTGDLPHGAISVTSCPGSHPVQDYLTIAILTVLLLLSASISSRAESIPSMDAAGNEGRNLPSSPLHEVRYSDIGQGFRTGTKVIGLSMGATYGMLVLGGEERHHLALFSASCGILPGGIKGKDKWYQGNLELRAEVFGGAQLNSRVRAITGLVPHLRYHFITGTRFVPYIDAGAGVVLTEIRGEDLGGVFQFTEQGVIGLDYFIQNKMSINLALQYIHVSSAGIYMPNDGVNTLGCFLGLNWFF